MDYYDLRQVALVGLVAYVVYALYQRRTRSSVKDIPGPPNPSWIHGHSWYWLAQDASVVEKRILEEYGSVARWNGPLGEDRLWIADPKAINHILRNSRTAFRKPDSRREIAAMVVDRGVAWAEGEAHRRQRKAMAPAFGPEEAKGLLPYFAQSATKLADKWYESIGAEGSGESVIMDVNSWLAKATLDAVGAGAFGYDFGALEGMDNPLTRTYLQLLHPRESFGHPGKMRVFAENVAERLPREIITCFLERSKHLRVVRFRGNREESRRIARTLIDQKQEELMVGAAQRDILNLLVEAHSSSQLNSRLTDEEMVGQIRTIMLAGHETTAKTLTFALWELAKNREVQEKLRTEVDEAWEKVKARGDSGFVANDFENMHYLVTIGKETLRVHSPVVEVFRIASHDDIIPLSIPIVGVSGKVYNELTISEGTPLVISVFGHNLNPKVWGADSYKWCPERWIDGAGNPQTPVGVYGNLATFSGGVRTCIGWRFAILEIHVFLATLVRQFEFSLPDGAPQVRRWRSAFIIPVVEGKEYEGVQLPLKVTPVKTK